LFSISTVASSTRMPTASASPPRVITLRDWFRILSMMMEVRIDRGIDVMTIRVLRQDPRNSRIMSAVRQPAIAPSRTTPVMVARTKTLWSKRKSTLRLGGRPARIWHQLPRLIHNRQGRVAAVAQDGQQDGVAPVASDEVRLGIEPVVDEGDISDVHRGPVRVPDGILFRSSRFTGLLLVATSYSYVRSSRYRPHR